jgi:hypothetical protein
MRPPTTITVIAWAFVKCFFGANFIVVFSSMVFLLLLNACLKADIAFGVLPMVQYSPLKI